MVRFVQECMLCASLCVRENEREREKQKEGEGVSESFVLTDFPSPKTKPRKKQVWNTIRQTFV